MIKFVGAYKNMIKKEASSLRSLRISTFQCRNESSFTFSNNRPTLEKGNIKHGKRKLKNQSCSKPNSAKYDPSDLAVKNSEQHILKSSKIPSNKGTQKLVADYSWIPKVPTTKNIKQKDFVTKVLYSGYRPIFIDPEQIKSENSGSTLYEFAMKLDGISEVSPWMTSSTGLELYHEWDNVPLDQMKKLQPFHAPSIPQNHKDSKIDVSTASKQESKRIIDEKIASLIGRKKGRKRPVIGALQMKKKLKSYE